MLYKNCKTRRKHQIQYFRNSEKTQNSDKQTAKQVKIVKKRYFQDVNNNVSQKINF